MPFSIATKLILLCALVAAAITAHRAAFKPSTNPWEMQDFEYRLYHDRGYAAALGRHSNLEAFRAPTPHQTYVAQKYADEQAEKIVFEFFTKIIANFLFYTLVGYCGWKFASIFSACINALALIVKFLCRALTQNRFALQVRQDFAETVQRTGQFFEQSYADFWNSDTITSISIARQRLINWISRHKFLLIVAPLALHLFLTTIRSQMHQSGEVFLTWEQLQHLDQGFEIPEWLISPRQSDASSERFNRVELLIDEEVGVIDDDASLTDILSHVIGHPSHVTDDNSAGPACSISSPPATMMPLFTATEDLEEEDLLLENRHLVSGSSFCQQCRQVHCCEVYQ